MHLLLDDNIYLTEHVNLLIHCDPIHACLISNKLYLCMELLQQEHGIKTQDGFGVVSFLTVLTTNKG